MRDLAVNFILNTGDIIITYYLYCGFTDTKRNFSKTNIILSFVSGAIAGICFNYLRSDISRILIHMSFFICIYVFSGKRLFKTLMIFMLISISVIVVQSVVVFLMFPFSIENTAVFFLIAQLISLVTIIIICNKLLIHKLLHVIEKELIVTLLFFICNCIILGILLYINFDITSIYPLYFLIIIIISLAGFYKTITKLFFYTNKLPLIKHEMENALTGIFLSANSTDNLESVREDINEYFKILGLSPSTPSTNNKNRIIYDFIQCKSEEKSAWKKLHFDTAIHYYEPHVKVSEPAIIIMLGILLDNAIQMSGSGKTIKIDICITEEYLSIQVANELLHQMEQDFIKIFEKGYSTKNQNGEIHGYGLPKLSEIVTRYGGEILIKEEYLKVERADYIFMIIEFK